VSEVNESKFPYGYLPEHLKERVKNWRSLSVGERMELTSELSRAAWEKIGVVYDPKKPMDKTIRRFRRKENGELEPYWSRLTINGGPPRPQNRDLGRLRTANSNSHEVRALVESVIINAIAPACQITALSLTRASTNQR